jgi:hypothetical protein
MTANSHDRRIDMLELIGGSRQCPGNVWNSIESYRWATNAECEAAGVISF